MTTVIIIRIRGIGGVRRKTRECLENLRLNRKHSCIIAEMNDSLKGMLTQAHDYIAWAPADGKSVQLLLEKRGRLAGGKPLDANFYAKLNMKDAAELAAALVEGKTTPKAAFNAGLNQIFRLAPPRKGYSSPKRPQPKGDLGLHKQGLLPLVERMV